MGTPSNHDRKTETADGGRLGSRERVRHFHKTCRLLSIECPAPDDEEVKGGDRDRNGPTPPQGVSPRAFPKMLVACSLAAAFLAVITLVFLIRSPLRRVSDYRLGADYQASPAATMIHEPRENRVYVATHGDGVHSLDARTGYFRQFTQRSTGGSLFTNDVPQLQRDDEGRI
ncbi:MAG: hypothetical protein NTY19_05900, partial [Planctomycetota bacterium]|nr:hypothetical protein [Planctomycetota bacterium]